MNTYTISLAGITAAFDEYGRLVEYRRESCGGQNILTAPPPMAFRMTCERGECKEVMAEPLQKPKVTATKETVAFTFDGIRTFDGRHHDALPVKLVLTAVFKDGKLFFEAEMDNRSEARILDFTYPLVGKITTLGAEAPALLLPVQCGMRYQNVGTWLGRMPRHRENAFNAYSNIYPGGCSMPWQALTDDKRTLFLTSHDPDFHPLELRQQGEAGRNTVTLEFTRTLCLEGGKQLSVPAAILDFYTGDWHRGARDYAAWMKPYRTDHERPEWIRNMTGYFLVINKQQFGYEMWPYDSLPKLYELAKAHGCDTLGLFGWYHSGHDNQYPDLKVSPSLGGEEVLKKNIAAVRQSGGHVTLYYQGHLIDETSDYYRNGEGRQVCAKNIWGSPYVEFYNKSHRSTFLMHFSRKMFAIACPSTRQWRDLMVQRQDWLAALGPDGCLYDQIGGCLPYICFDKTHDHPQGNPALAHTSGRRKLLSELQEHSKQINKDFAFMTEHINDLYSGYADVLHGIMSAPGAPGALAAAVAEPEKVSHLNYPALFRYCFPETVITVRNPNPHLGERLSNYALTYGFRPEMELRYQADCDDVLNDSYKASREYALAVASLRNKYAEQLLRGEFRDTDELAAVPAGLTATCFVAGDSMAVVLWNDTAQDIALEELAVRDGWKLCETSGVQATMTQWPAFAKAGQVLVGLFRN